MTDFDQDNEFDNDPDNDQEPEPQPDRNPLRPQLRKLEKENKVLRAEAEAGKAATRELAFSKAGIDLAAPGAKSFLKAYDGDLTADAIKAAAAEDGLVAAPEDDPISPEEKAAHQRISDPSAGTRPVGSHDFDSQIAAATAAGNHLAAIALKQQRAAENRAKR